MTRIVSFSHLRGELAHPFVTGNPGSATENDKFHTVHMSIVGTQDVIFDAVIFSDMFRYA